MRRKCHFDEVEPGLGWQRARGDSVPFWLRSAETLGGSLKVILRGVGLAAALLASASPSNAHKTWNNGLPVPDWVTRSCCGASDAHRLSPDQVHRVENGYRIEGYPRVIFDAQVLPSEDGEYWAFYSENTDADGNKFYSSVYCFFAPTAG